MSAPSLRFNPAHSDPLFAPAAADALDELCAAGHLSGRARLAARALAERNATSVSDVVLATGWAEPESLSRATHRHWGAGDADLATSPPPRALIDRVGIDICLRMGVIPWRQFAGGIVLACSEPAKFDKFVETLPADLGRPIMALTSRAAIHDCIATLYKQDLIERAETRGEPGMTCRSLSPIKPVWVLAVIAVLGLCFWAVPHVASQSILMISLLLLVCTTAQKAVLVAASLIANRRKPNIAPETVKMMDHAPSITLFVPLLREAEVAAKLVTSMEALRYPRALLEIVILVEADDAITRCALDDLRLQPHMRVIYVPRGNLKTKPRAMNYALPFARGDIIGIYDAEDRPEPDQLLKVAATFATAAPDVACLQGRLAFYNAKQNLLSRCFALDYAAWFRLMLPGLSALDLPIPLGGTTLFLRRHIIDKLDGWDAHNVTEDAELGFRIYASGYRVQLLDSTTFEEANCYVWPWIKQRSRWMKGYLKTWLMLMRKPVRLFQRLGFAGFISFQVMVMGSVATALTAPIIWSMILPMLGVSHPMLTVWDPDLLVILLLVLFAGEAVSLGVFVIAASAKDLRWLLPWIAALPLYFLMATPAALRAVMETALNPHHWEKTTHGKSN